MATTTVRLDDDDESILDTLSPIFGGRSNTIRQALRHLSAEIDRQRSLTEFLAEWETEAGPIGDDDITAMTDRYCL